MIEHRPLPLPPWEKFAIRVLRAFGMGALLIGVSLGIGMLGYHYAADLTWLDAFLNAAMILTGMGPVNPLTGKAAKLFAGFYALFSGVVFLSTVAVLAAPIAHRILLRFHLGMDEEVPGP
jgi:pimeloyl-ACP methyl ester carboxylesterase